MNDFLYIINSCKEFKSSAIDILGLEQSIYKVEEFHGLFDIAILTANIDEFESVRSIVDNIKRATFNKNDSTIYHSAEIHSTDKIYKILIPFPYAMGIEAAASLTTKVIQIFRPRYIFMTGSCAGNKNITKIGDVLVAEKSLNYQGIVAIEKKDESQDKKFMHNISSINGHLKNKLELFSQTNEFKKIKNSYPNKNKIAYDLSCHVGLVVTGSSLSRSRQLIEEINSTYLGVKGLDMETYGLYYASTQVFKDYAPNFVSIKSVSDFGDDTSHTLSSKERKAYALFTSSNFLKMFINHYLD
jgi:nucleoside phosphorylase